MKPNPIENSSNVMHALKNTIVTLISLFLSLQSYAALKTASKIMPFVEDTAEELFEKAQAYQKSSKLDSALICYSMLVETYRNTNDMATHEIVGKSLSEMGQCYYINYRDNIRAYQCLAEAQTIFEKNNNMKECSLVLLNLGNLFNMYDYIFPAKDKSSLKRSRELYEKSLQMSIASKSWDIVCSAYINMVMMSLPFSIDKQLNDKTRDILRDSIPPKTMDYQFTNLLCVGTDALAEGNFDDARKAFIEMRDSIGLSAPREKYMADVCLSAVALAEKKYDEAIDCIRWILMDNSGVSDSDVHMEVYDLLAKYSSFGGNQTMSDYYRIKYFEAKDSLMRDVVALEPTRIELELDDIKQNARKIEEERQLIWLWLIFSLIIVVGLSIVSFIITRKNRDLKLKNKVIFDQLQPLLHIQPSASVIKKEEKEYEEKELKQNIEIAEELESSKSDEPDKAEEGEAKRKYRDSSMTDETRHMLIGKIEEVLGNMDKICDSNFSLQKLTSLVGSNTSYISRIVNEHYGMSFGNLLNRYRIQEVCRRMADSEEYGHLTIEAISESVGFNTRATFVKAFRLNIGMLPSEYMRLLKKESENKD
ncbi:MAG: AraC family transcriptional regulator [Bacteroides sp.]|nr:AraC family transcriptional regulator [Bacteroides sp.]